MAKLSAELSIDQVLDDLAGMPAFLAGSSVAGLLNYRPYAYTDIDVFVPNKGAYFACVQRLLGEGYSLESDKFEKMWRRHLNYGFNQWKTNSMKVTNESTGIEVNIIYKKVEGHETTQLSQVLESFDFGLLAVGFEAATRRFHDMRTYFFGPGADDGRPLPFLPYREDGISQGFMSQHIMLRMPGRYARYAHTYGYDLSLVKPVMLQGYAAYAAYKLNRSKAEDIQLGQIATALGAHIELDQFDELLQFEKTLPAADGLDMIMAGLE